MMTEAAGSPQPSPAEPSNPQGKPQSLPKKTGHAEGPQTSRGKRRRPPDAVLGLPLVLKPFGSQTEEHAREIAGPVSEVERKAGFGGVSTICRGSGRVENVTLGRHPSTGSEPLWANGGPHCQLCCSRRSPAVRCFVEVLLREATMPR